MVVPTTRDDDCLERQAISVRLRVLEVKCLTTIFLRGPRIEPLFTPGRAWFSHHEGGMSE